MKRRSSRQFDIPRMKLFEAMAREARGANRDERLLQLGRRVAIISNFRAKQNEFFLGFQIVRPFVKAPSIEDIRLFLNANYRI